MGNIFGALPAWTNGVLLENLPTHETQIVDGDLNLRQSKTYTTNLNVETDIVGQILFTRVDVEGVVAFDSNQNVPNINLLNFNVINDDANRTFGHIITNVDMVCNKNSAFSGRVYPYNNVTTNQLLIKMPKIDPPNIPPKTNPFILTQNSVFQVPLPASKLLFSYPYNSALPNDITFNISEFTNPIIFIKDIDGILDLPVTINIINGFLTITGIPVVNNECVAFLFIM